MLLNRLESELYIAVNLNSTIISQSENHTTKILTAILNKLLKVLSYCYKFELGLY